MHTISSQIAHIQIEERIAEASRRRPLRDRRRDPQARRRHRLPALRTALRLS